MTNLSSTWSRGSIVVSGVLALLVAVTIVAQATVLADDDTVADAQVGQVVQIETLEPELTGDPADVEIPGGMLRLTVGEPRQTLIAPDAEDDAAGHLIDPPDDGSFLPVAWEFVRTDTTAAVPVTDGIGLPDVTMAIVLDGDEYAIGIDGSETIQAIADDDVYAQTSAHQVGVAVPGEPDRVAVRIGYDGEEQTVEFDRGVVAGSEPGRFAGVATPPVRSKAITAPAAVPAGYRLADHERRWARVQVTGQVLTPYVRGLGWADEGTQWLVLTLQLPDMSLTLEPVDGGPERYTFPAHTSQLRFRLGDRVPEGGGLIGTDGVVDGHIRPVTDYRLVVPVRDGEAPGVLRVDAELLVESSAKTVHVGWRLSLPELAS